MVRDTGLRVGDILDVRARFPSDEAMLERMPMLVRADLDACREWKAQHPPRDRDRVPRWLRFFISVSVALIIAWMQYSVGNSPLVWPLLYFVLTFIGTWSAVEFISQKSAA